MDEKKPPRLSLVVSNTGKDEDPASASPRAIPRIRHLRAIQPSSEGLIRALRTHDGDMAALLKDHPAEACLWMAKRLDNGPGEQELLDAIRSLSPAEVSELRGELGRLKLFSVFPSVREAAERKLGEHPDSI